eukprot:COSAG01_NODE_45047_length_413_cov_0.710191_1_plen_123_part_01
MSLPGGAPTVVQIEVLTRTRVEELAPLIHDGFGDKRCCLCLGRDIDDTSQWGLIATLLQGYAAYPDEKIAACGIAVEYPAPGPDDAAGTPPTTDTIGTIVGFYQVAPRFYAFHSFVRRSKLVH